jgi:transposase
LKASCGYSNPAIGKILSIHYNTVARYIKTYREKGIEGLYINRYQGKGSQKEVYKASIIEDFNKNPVCSIAQAAARIKALTGIERKPTQVRAFIRRHGFKYRKPAAVPGKLNPEKQNQFYMPNIMILPINSMMPSTIFLILSMINVMII